LACWTQAQKAWVQIAAATLSGNSLRQTVHTHCASVHQAALASALLSFAAVTQDWRKVLAAYCRVYDSRHLQADCQEPGSAPEQHAQYSSLGYLTFFTSPVVELLRYGGFGAFGTKKIAILPSAPMV